MWEPRRNCSSFHWSEKERKTETDSERYGGCEFNSLDYFHHNWNVKMQITEQTNRLMKLVVWSHAKDSVIANQRMSNDIRWRRRQKCWRFFCCFSYFRFGLRLNCVMSLIKRNHSMIFNSFCCCRWPSASGQRLLAHIFRTKRAKYHETI